jgi:tRNA A-37 threonylcarbamoyl transferase component Bud32
MARAAETQGSARAPRARASRRGRWLLADRYERHPGDAMRLLLTPAVLLVTSFGSGAGVLVERRVHGLELRELNADQLGDQLVEEVWRQVDALHRAGIAHRELDPSNILVDDQGRPWLLLDLDRALMTDDRRLLERDDADLREALAGLAPAPARGG